MLTRLLLCVVLALGLAGCHPEEESYGYVRVDFGTGYAYSSSGWYYSCSYTTLVVNAAVVPYGDAVVVDQYWTVVAYPYYAPVLGDPYGRTTSMTFATSGSYVLDYRVRYAVDGIIYQRVERLELYISPTGVG